MVDPWVGIAALAAHALTALPHERRLRARACPKLTRMSPGCARLVLCIRSSFIPIATTSAKCTLVVLGVAFARAVAEPE